MDRHLHSRYNPHSEAERYIDSLNLKDDIKLFVLIEPGRGYLIPVLRERFKESGIIVFHIEDQDALPFADVPEMTGTESADVQNFLEANIGENSGKIRIIEWRPSLNLYKETYVKLLSQVVDFIKRTEAGNRTTAAFGKRWVRNFFGNLDKLNKSLLYRRTEIPVIVTGSGPSLEQALPAIKEAQDSCLIIAASSSVMALSHGGISADLTITTDGGSWALKHLYSCFRQKTKALAVNLCASLPSQCADTPFLLINDGSFWQSLILHELNLPSVIVTQKGTVTATAVELSLALSGANIYLAGADFSVNDIITHVKPYSFDDLFFGNANRFNPYYSERFMRAFYTVKGESLDIYASWFKTRLDIWEKRIFSITQSDVFKTGTPKKSSEKKNVFNLLKAQPVSGGSSSLRERGAAALLNALKNGEYSRNIRRELTSLLFADSRGKKVTDEELEAAIRKTALKDTA